MKITKIETQKRRQDRVNIYIDDRFAFGLTDTLRYKYDLFKDKEVSQEFIDDVLNAEEQNKVIEYTLKFLSYRERSQKEVYDRLKIRGYDEDKINNAINYCLDKNYINDTRFAETFIQEKTEINKLGSYRIKQELSIKGISREIIEEVLEPDYEQELEMATELALKKVSSYKNDNRNAQYRKLGGYLQRRGYNFDIVREVLENILD
ncbi:MAG TPA: RecX family transcriptional regulator [Tissierellaceae bacterium]|nr:RecX family transcriptional regulator [Tissierellaceae bacterium]